MWVCSLARPVCMCIVSDNITNGRVPYVKVSSNVASSVVNILNISNDCVLLILLLSEYNMNKYKNCFAT